MVSSNFQFTLSTKNEKTKSVTKEMCAISYMHKTNGACVGAYLCNYMHNMKKAE